jgi:hypothetical protein
MNFFNKNTNTLQIMLKIFFAACILFMASVMFSCVRTEEVYVDEDGHRVTVSEHEQIADGALSPKTNRKFATPIITQKVEKYGHTFIEFFRGDYGHITGSGAVYAVVHNPDCTNPKHPENQVNIIEPDSTEESY